MNKDRMLIGFDLLDRQIVDQYGRDVGKVDDVELDLTEDGVPYLAALLVGPQALGPRLGGWLGRAVTSTARRMRLTPAGPVRIPFAVVAEVRGAVTLTVSRDLLAEPELERWLREHVISRIPGSGDAG